MTARHVGKRFKDLEKLQGEVDEFEDVYDPYGFLREEPSEAHPEVEDPFLPYPIVPRRNWTVIGNEPAMEAKS